MEKGISVVLPAYQEAENLKNILPVIREALGEMGVSCEILVIDTMEPMDETESVCEESGAVYVPREGGNMYGDAIRTGIRRALYSRIVVMDADGSHDPKDIVKFYKQVKKHNFDIVIGSRYIKGGDTHNPFILRVMSYMLNIAYRVMFGLKVKDVSDSFRMYNASKLKKLELTCDNFDIVEEILIRMKIQYPDLMIKEVPIYFNKRVHGESKRDLKKFIKSYITTMAKLLRIKQQATRQRNR